jgi:hypothetical protein
MTGITTSCKASCNGDAKDDMNLRSTKRMCRGAVRVPSEVGLDEWINRQLRSLDPILRRLRD